MRGVCNGGATFQEMQVKVQSWQASNVSQTSSSRVEEQGRIL